MVDSPKFTGVSQINLFYSCQRLYCMSIPVENISTIYVHHRIVTTSLPWTGVIRRPLDRVLHQKVFIAIMDRVMSLVGGADEELWIQKKIRHVVQVFFADRVHVVHDDFAEYLPAGDTQVASIIPKDNFVSDGPPFWRPLVELLIDPAIKPECIPTDPSLKPQISVTLLECRKISQFGVRSNLHRDAPTRCKSA